MSFTKIRPKEVKLRCHRCGKTRDVRIVFGKTEWCAKCRRNGIPGGDWLS